MKAISGSILGFILALACVSAAKTTAKKFSVGIMNKAPKTGRFSLSSAKVDGGLTVSRQNSCMSADGNVTIEVAYTNASGMVVHQRMISVPADASKPMSDRFGNQISDQVPKWLVSADDSWANTLDTVIGNAAKDGRLGL